MQHPNVRMSYSTLQTKRINRDKYLVRIVKHSSYLQTYYISRYTHCGIRMKIDYIIHNCWLWTELIVLCGIRIVLCVMLLDHIILNEYENSLFNFIHQILCHNNSSWFIWKLIDDSCFFFLKNTKSNPILEQKKSRNIFNGLIWRKKTYKLLINSVFKVLFYTDERPVWYWHETKKRIRTNSRGNDLCAMKNDMWSKQKIRCFSICIAYIAPFWHWIDCIDAIDWIVTLCRVICNIYVSCMCACVSV